MSIRIESKLTLPIAYTDLREYHLHLSNPTEGELFRFLLDSIQTYFSQRASQYSELNEFYKISDKEQRKEYQQKLLDGIKFLTA